MQNLNPASSPVRRSIEIIALITAGEAIFFLPFVIARVFRPTLLDVFQLTNLELGIAFSVYGFVAMLAYFPGGPLADRYAPRKLMALALAATSIGGLVMASIPSLGVLKVLYGFWGVTTILLFWSPLIRATRNWGGSKLPGRAFGFLDGGRGLVAAAVGTIAVAVFASLLPVDVDRATPEQRTDAFRRVILIFTAITFATSLLVWSGLLHQDSGSRKPSHTSQFYGIARVIRMPTVWLQATVVVCAYVGYKGLDDISLYAHEALGFVSVIGYTPDVFMGPLMGFLLDRSPGATGHHHVFAASPGFRGSGSLRPSFSGASPGVGPRRKRIGDLTHGASRARRMPLNCQRADGGKKFR